MCGLAYCTKLMAVRRCGGAMRCLDHLQQVEDHSLYTYIYIYMLGVEAIINSPPIPSCPNVHVYYPRPSIVRIVTPSAYCAYCHSHLPDLSYWRKRFPAGLSLTRTGEDYHRYRRRRRRQRQRRRREGILPILLTEEAASSTSLI